MVFVFSFIGLNSNTTLHVNKLLHKRYNLQDDVYKPTSNLWGKNHISHQDFFFLYLFWG